MPPGFQSYKLRHANAVDLAPQVRDVISGAPGKPEVVIDKGSNTLLIRGGADAQRLASQLISALDQPAQTTAKTVQAQRGEPVVRGYRLPAGDNEKLLAELKKRFPATTGVNLAIDKRTGQLLAFGPPDVQRKLAEQLGEPAPEDQAEREPLLQGPRKEIVQREHALKNINWQSMEAFLQRIWAAKAAVEMNKSGEVASFRMRNLSGEEALARINRRSNEVSFEGSRNTADEWGKLISVLDGGPARKNESIQLVPVERADPEQLHDAIELVKAAFNQPELPQGQQRAAQSLPGRRPPQANELVAKIFQQENQPPAAQPNNEQPENMPPVAQPAAEEEGGAIGPVRIEFLEGLDVVILTGNKRDVARVAKIIQEIQDISKETTPIIELHPLRNVDSTAVGDLVVQLYNDSLAARFGRVSITALDKPNALLFIGRRNSIDAVLDLVKKLDVPTTPQTQFKVISLRYMAAADAGLLLTDFFAERETLGVKVKIATEIRINAVIIHGGPRDIQEAERLIASIDLPKSESENELRVFKLINAMASDLATVLQQAIAAQGGGVSAPGAQGQGQQGGGQQGGGNQPQNQQQSGGTTQNQLRSSSLTYMVVDREGNRLLESGLLNELRITADVNANALLVRGPARSMDLIGALIKELDRLPDISAQIKVFTIINGDATNLMSMLQTLFGQTTVGGGQGSLLNQPVTAGGENSLVPLRFSVDQRTNSIIASGSQGDLGVVEAILLRLDEGDIRQRKTTVYRLKNAPAIDVANAINQFLTSERQVQQLAPTASSPFEQLEREVVVVPEAVSNSLIVSATPRFYDEIARVVEDLDARPPMVMIQVLIAEVSLNDFEEFGAEFGLQDALLFDRSVINNVVAAPGYAFNNAPLANVGTNPALSDNLAGQSLTNFSLGRTNGNLGYGGLVLSASNESISILIRALQDAQRLQVLSRPQVTTLDNQSAFVQVGQRVPYATGTNNSVNGFSTQTQLINVGLLLGVTPRISPDGLVVMEIDAEKSDLNPGPGITIGIGADGTPITQPIINTTLAQTTVSARSGQTVILGGLISKTRSYNSRRVPYLSDIPVLGRLFRYDSSTEERTELLIIMTPHIIKNEADADWIKQVESDRMSWCLADVVEIHGDSGLSGGNGLWGPALPPPIYPDVDPSGAPVEWLPEGEVPPVRRSGPTTPSGSIPGAAAPTEAAPLPAPIETPVQPVPGSQSSNQRVPQAQMPLRAATEQAMEAVKAPPQYDQAGLRSERSDNATIFYAEPKARPLSVSGARASEQPPEVAPAYYQQPRPGDRYQGQGSAQTQTTGWQGR